MAGVRFDTPITLDRDTFMRRLIASLGYLNEGILGSDAAGAYVMNVGLSMGAAIEAEYKAYWGLERPLTVDEYAHVIVDLKQKIKGNFSLVEADDAKVVVQTTSCPFDEFVRQSPSLCFMTSSVFGGIAARNFGYAKTVLHKRIALGDPGCYVTVHLKRTPQAEAAIGKEYFPETDQASPDIAEQLRLMDSVRRLRRQLGEASSRWEEVLRGAADAICVVATDGTIVLANARWRDLLGAEGEELVGRRLEQLVHPTDSTAVGEALAQALGGGRVLGRSARMRHQDGTWRHALISGGPLRDESGGVLGALAIVRDVTSEREIQRVKDEFMTSVSHELRTPATSVSALTALLLRSLQEQGSIEPEILAERLKTIQREADRLTLLGTELLDVTRIHVGELPLQRERLDLRAVVQASVDARLAALGADSPHRLQVDLPGTQVAVVADRRRISQAIEHLLDNAVKFSPRGGEIRVVLSTESGLGRVSVSDQGIGIPERDLPNVFTPFFRASNAPLLNYRGIGLGLHLTRAIAQAHGGDLSASSAEGSGACFTLSLPLDTREVSSPE